MYKYYSELDKPNDFIVYLKLRGFDRKQDRYVRNVNIIPFMKKHGELFKKIDIIDMFIEGSCESILFKYADLTEFSYEQYMILGDFFNKKDEEYPEIKYMKQKLDFDSSTLENLLREYYIYCNFLIEIYPNYKEFICNTRTMIKNALDELKSIVTISVPPLHDGVIEKFPNAWYITPNGYLYNTGFGHKEGNLVYPFYYVIKELLKNGKNVPNINLNEQISDILQRGYVTASEFKTYSNLIYDIPTILTPSVEHAMEEFKKLMTLEYEEKEKITKFPHYERSYQKNIVTLVIGYLAAKTSLFQSFLRLNNSSFKGEMINELLKLSFDDILVRFCGFHKISSISDKTITTSSIKSIEDFKEYLDNGWTLDIIPGIVYDGEIDKLSEVDFDWYYVNEYIKKQLNEYNGKGKILTNNVRLFGEK